MLEDIAEMLVRSSSQLVVRCEKMVGLPLPVVDRRWYHNISLDYWQLVG
jgi:hypothetical protein